MQRYSIIITNKYGNSTAPEHSDALDQAYQRARQLARDVFKTATVKIYDNNSNACIYRARGEV